MAFARKTLDGVAAWKRALRKGTARPGYCLAEVHEAFGYPQSDRVFPYANATEARVRARQLGAIKGTDLDRAPEGSVLYWSNVIVKGKDLGHIAFKGPKNTIVTIDNPTRGRWGQVTVAAFRKKWSWLKFEGYAYGPGAYLGHTVTVATDLKPAPGNSAGGNSNPFEEDDMFTDADRKMLKEAHSKATNTYAGMFDGASVKVDGVVKKFNYGVLPIVVESQRRLAVQAGQIAALSTAVSQIKSGAPLNMKAIEDAAERGASGALDGLTLRVVSD